MLRECGLSDVDVKIAKAAAEKDEKDREWKAKEATAAATIVAYLKERGGSLQRDQEPWASWFNLKEDDPLYDAMSIGISEAAKLGLIIWGPRYQSISLAPAKT